MDSEMRATTRRNFTVNVLDGGFFGFALGAASFATVLPLFVSRLTDSAILLALIPAIHLLGWQLPQLLTAQHVARLQRYLPFVLKTTIHERVPFFGLAIVALLLGRLDPEVALLIIYLLLVWQGLGGGFAATAWQSMLAKIIPPQRLGIFFGTQSAASSLGGAVAAALAGWLLAALPYPVNFAAVFIVTSVAMVVSWVFLALTRESPHEVAAETHKETPLQLLRRLPAVLRQDRNFVWYMVARWVVQVGFIGTAFYSVHAVNGHGVSEVTIGFYTSLMLITQMLANPTGGWIGDRWSHRVAMGLGTIALGLSALVAWAAPNGGWFAIVFLLAGIAHASYWAPGLAIVLEFAPVEERQIYIGLANTLTAPATLIVPLLGGWLADNYGYGAAFLLSLVGAAVAAGLFFLVVRDPRRMRAAVAQEFHLTGAGG